MCAGYEFQCIAVGAINTGRTASVLRRQQRLRDSHLTQRPAIANHANRAVVGNQDERLARMDIRAQARVNRRPDVREQHVFVPSGPIHARGDDSGELPGVGRDILMSAGKHDGRRDARH